jgi:hypothetical protein
VEEEEDEGQKNNSNFKWEKNFSINEKIKIAKEAHKTSIHKCSLKYLIDRKYIRLWIRDLNILEKLDKKIQGVIQQEQVENL